MGSYSIECVLQCNNHLGEGPVWDSTAGQLYWLDCTGNRVGRAGSKRRFLLL
jgi:L-arabinonolactonase